jgi:phosphoribosylformylglycinamidine synthase
VKFAIVVFPGSNCDQDCYHVATDLLGCEAEFVWHHERDLKGADAVILPGGFAYGDYLRAGALARFSPVMESVSRFAAQGGPVLGICNGFQVLLEAGLLPGAVRVNRGLRYVCRDIFLKMPIGHMEGNYTAPAEELDRLERDGGVVFRYCDESGRVTEEANPNGAANGIAGVANRDRNVVGLMPHPDRCAEELLGNDMGRRMFESVVLELTGAGRR